MADRVTEFFVSAFLLGVLFLVGTVITHSPMLSVMIIAMLIMMGS